MMIFYFCMYRLPPRIFCWINIEQTSFSVVPTWGAPICGLSVRAGLSPTRKRQTRICANHGGAGEWMSARIHSYLYLRILWEIKQFSRHGFPVFLRALDKALSVPCCRICIRHSRNRLRPGPLQVGMFGKPCLLLCLLLYLILSLLDVWSNKKQRPPKESLSKVIIYSILNSLTYYRLTGTHFCAGRMSAVAPFSS